MLSLNNPSEPEFKHDCASCEFHGRSNRGDIYTCKGVLGTSIIVRFSDDPPDYTSSPIKYVSEMDVTLSAALKLVEGYDGR